MRDERAGRPRPIAAMLPKVTAKAIGRRGFTQGVLLNDWRAIVGADLAEVSQPEKLVFPRGERLGGVLQIRVSGGVAIELQHLEPLVIERINGHFGYGAVARLRLIHAPIPRAPVPRHTRRPTAAIDPHRKAMLQDLLGGVEDEALRAALKRLGTAILRHEAGRKIQ
ncbi:MAG: DciA family protein [Alphaproteobacteria bacterium]